MAQSHKVRLGDGSVIDLERDDIRSWYERGLISRDSQVQKPGSRAWTPLSEAVDLRQWRAPGTPKGISVPATRAGGGPPAVRARSSASSRASSPPTPRPVARPGPSLPLPGRGTMLLLLSAVAIAGALYWTSPWWLNLILGSESQRRVKAATRSERQLADDSLGLKLELPRGWSLLREGHGFFAAPASARLALAEPSTGAFGFLAVETPSRGFVTLDAFLDRMLEERGRTEPTLHEVRREAADGKGRRVIANRQAEDGTVEEVLTGWKDGWTYYALVVWAPADKARAGPASESLRQGFTTAGHMGVRLREAVDTVSREVPLLTPEAAEMLMGQSAAQILEPAEAFRRTFLLTSRGLPTLAKAEQKEMGTLNTDLYAALPRPDRARLGAYIERVRSGFATDPALDQQMSRLVKQAVLELPPNRRGRLQALFEKAVRAAVASGVVG